MKKSLFCLIAAAFCFAACQVEEPTASLKSEDVLSAKIEQSEMTKTVLAQNNNILWSENDQVVGFMKSSYGHRYQIDPGFAGKTYADFTKVSTSDGDKLSAGVEWDHNVVYYPYSETVSCVKAEKGYTLGIELPAEQTYVVESFSNNLFPMVAVSEGNDITFNNVCGALMIQLMGIQQVKSIKVEGNNNEILAGAATVSAIAGQKPAITMNSTTATAVTLNCGEGVQLNTNTPVEFIITLPPVEFTNGFTVTVTDASNTEYTIEAKKANTVERSKLLVMPNKFLGAEEEEDVNTITIDGDFSDWDALPASKVYVAKRNEDARYQALKTLKINATGTNINGYIEVDSDVIIADVSVYMNIYINADNSSNTADDVWKGQAGSDYMTEGYLMKSNAFVSYNPKVYTYNGSLEKVEWEWVLILENGKGISSGAGSNFRYEFTIDKAKLADEHQIIINDTFGIGVLISQNWKTTGALPCGESGNKAPMLEITCGNGGNTSGAEEEETVAPELKNGDRVLATNRNVQKFVEEVTYPDHDYTETYVRDYYGGYGHNYNGEVVNSDKPEAYSIYWTANYDAGELTLELSEPEWSATQTVEAGSDHVEITNLVPNTHYTYKVTAANGTVMTEGEFDTYGTVRHVFFKSNVRNCRDLGGWKTYEGKTVKFHKIYRGGRLEAGTLSNSGRKALIAEGIKAQLDIRGTSDVLTAPAIEGFDFCAPIIETGGDSMLKQDGGEKTRMSVQFVIDCIKENKPVYFHCSLGRDRTGTLAMVILGVLDVIEGDISKEYELSYFSPKGWSIASSESYNLFQNVRTTWAYKPAAEYIWNKYVQAGERFSAGVERYLLEIGISQEDINTFRSLMLADAPAN